MDKRKVSRTNMPCPHIYDEDFEYRTSYNTDVRWTLVRHGLMPKQKPKNILEKWLTYGIAPIKVSSVASEATMQMPMPTN